MDASLWTAAASLPGSSWLTSPGRSLELIGVAHAAVGLVLHRHGLASIVRGHIVDTVGDHGDRATAWWFMMTAPMVWTTGRLLRSADVADDVGAQRSVGIVVTATGLAGIAVMPRSPFWAVAATGVRVLHQSAQARRRPPVRGTGVI